MSSMTEDMDLLRSKLRYDKRSGKLFWKVPHYGLEVGSEAGYINSTGNRVLTFHGRQFQSARVAWALATGAFPSGRINFLNGDRTDTRWCNLRLK